MANDLKVYVLTHKEVPYIVNDEWHIPIQVGRANASEKIYNLGDDTGDNISEKNPFYLETTGIYWIWKNAEKSDFIGQEHYRRHFNLDKELIKDILSDNDIIVPSPRDFGELTVEKQYENCHNIQDLKVCEEIIKEKYPEYSEDYDKYIKNGTKMYYANSFITSWDNYNTICDFVFGVLDEYCKRTGCHTLEDFRNRAISGGNNAIPGDHENDGDSWIKYQSEIGGFLSERLVNLCIRHNYKKVYEVQFQLLEEEWKRNHTRTLLCCIGRLENPYIREFVDYYNFIGVTNICLYDNNRDGEEDFHDVIGDYIDSGYVILKDYRNITTPCQLQAYNECYEEYKNDYDWFLYFDIDEFMFINNGGKINGYLAHREFDRYNMIHVNWLNFGDGGMLKSDGRGLLERISKPIDINSKSDYPFPDNFHIKTIVRGGLKTMKFTATPHTPSIEGKCCNATGIECDGNSPFAPYDYRWAGLRHFTTKTAEEYAKKVKRGFCDANRTDGKKLLQLFFKRNEVTEEKVNLFKNEVGIDMSYLLPHVFEGEKSKDVQIFSLCYAKKDFQFLDTKYVTPLQVGAANGTDICTLKDNEGDNISSENYFYIENTGTYWIWKNIKDAKYKGQMQYRRPLSGLTDETNYEELFNKYDVITCEPFHHPDHKVPTPEEPMIISADTVEQGYAFSNCADDLYIMEMVVKIYFPDYAEDWDKYIKNGPDLYYSNGFIMRAEDFDRYCEFLFACLNGYLSMANIHNKNELIEHVKYNLEVGKYPRYEGRKYGENDIRWQSEIGGFLSERLWTLWVQHNFIKERIFCLPYIKMESNMYT